VLELEAQPRHSQSREILTRTPLPGSDSRGLRHRWSLLGVGFCRSCCILPNVPADKGKWSSPIAPPRFAARSRAECAGRSVRSSASHRRRRHNELCWRWVRVLATLPARGRWARSGGASCRRNPKHKRCRVAGEKKWRQERTRVRVLGSGMATGRGNACVRPTRG